MMIRVWIKNQQLATLKCRIPSNFLAILVVEYSSSIPYTYRMLLRDYIEKYTNQTAFAVKIEMSRDVVGRWLRKECYPTRASAEKIMKATEGKVTIKDIYA